MASDDYASFSDLLRHARRRANLTQEELAERSGLSVRGISDLERGLIHTPRRDTVELLVDALNLSDEETRQWEELRRKLSSRVTVARPQRTARGSPQGNLPIPLTSLIGREREARDIAALLCEPDRRLVTMTGPGGVGKTRLAIEVGHMLQDAMPGGVWFIDLAPLHSSELVIQTIADTLEISGTGQSMPYAALIQRLRESRALLVVDNCEHVVDAATDLYHMLTACPALRVLVTSRVALHIQGEHEYPLAPLELPPPLSQVNERDLTENPAISLFIQRAQAVRPDFRISADNIDVVAEICRRLDGLPLGIELAAARSRLLPPHDLLRRMNPSLPLLVGTNRSVPDRQRTLVATIQWSYDLLSPDDQRLLRELSLFRGGWTLDAAEAVASSSLDVLSSLQSLVDHSLVQVIEQSDGSARYRMLETVREFALERLMERGENEPVFERFARYYLELSERAGQELHGAEQGRWLMMLEDEHANLRWVLDESHRRATSGDLQAMCTSLRIAPPLWWFWYIRGHMEEGAEHLQTALEFFRTIPAAHGILDQDDDLAFAYAEACIGLGAFPFSRAILNSGTYRRFLDEYKQAIEQSLVTYRRLDRRAEIARALLFFGFVAQNGGYFKEAEPWLIDGIELYREIGDAGGIALGLLGLGEMAWRAGEHARAVELLRESVTTFTDVGDRRGNAASTATLGGAYLRKGDLSRAGSLLRESLQIRYEIGDLGGLAWNLEHLAERSILGSGTTEGAARAARLRAAAKHLRDQMGYWIAPADQPMYDQVLANIQKNLSDVAFVAVWESGRTMSLEDVVAYALEPDCDEVLATAPAGLSARELEVLRLLVEGNTNQQIARTLFISPYTVGNHVASIMNKFGVDSRTAAVARALRQGIV